MVLGRFRLTASSPVGPRSRAARGAGGLDRRGWPDTPWAFLEAGAALTSDHGTEPEPRLRRATGRREGPSHHRLGSIETTTTVSGDTSGRCGTIAPTPQPKRGLTRPV